MAEFQVLSLQDVAVGNGRARGSIHQEAGLAQVSIECVAHPQKKLVYVFVRFRNGRELNATIAASSMNLRRSHIDILKLKVAFHQNVVS